MAVTPLIIQAVYTAKYTARTRRCTRSYTRVHGPHTTATRPYTCREHSRVHGLVHGRLRAVHTAIKGRTRPVHGVYEQCTCLHGRVRTRPVYTAVCVYGPCTRPCTWPVNGLVHRRVHGPYTALYPARTRLCTWSCHVYTTRTGLLHGRVCADVTDWAKTELPRVVHLAEDRSEFRMFVHGIVEAPHGV